MNILPHERPGVRPHLQRTIQNITDAELESMGWWRLSNLPGVKVGRNTIKARLESGMGKREACTRPTDRDAEWKRK